MFNNTLPFGIFTGLKTGYCSDGILRAGFQITHTALNCLAEYLFSQFRYPINTGTILYIEDTFSCILICPGNSIYLSLKGLVVFTLKCSRKSVKNEVESSVLSEINKKFRRHKFIYRSHFLLYIYHFLKPLILILKRTSVLT